jgi:hypothetical protein
MTAASEVPSKYDLVLTVGSTVSGYTFLRTLDGSYLSASRHRAEYTYSPTFVDRSNVSNQYGDSAQDFFLTVRQRDWSQGEQVKYFRSGQDGRYWTGSNVDVSTPGQVQLTKQTAGVTFAAAAITGCQDDSNGDRSSVVVTSSTNLCRLQVDGTLTDLGAHGLGAAPSKYAMVNDAAHTFISTTTAGTVGVRRWNGAAYSTFSASGADSLAFVNNSLYGYRSSNNDLVRWDTAGTLTSLFTWKSANGSTTAATSNVNTPILRPYGGKLLILFPYTQEAAELWVYDGVAPYRLAVFPLNFSATSMTILYGVVYVGGNFLRSTSTTTMNARPAVLFFDGSSLGLLWRANNYGTTSLTATAIPLPGPVLGTSDGRLVLTDDTMNTILAYNPALGGVSTIGSYTGTTTDAQMISTGSMVAMTRAGTAGYYFPKFTTNTTGYVASSLIDFESSLTKLFRSIKVEFDAAPDGDGGSVDIAYQVDSLTGAYTTLQTGAVSGTEYALTNISGHAISVKITLNKGTSTDGPTLRSQTVRAAPQMTSYPFRTYNLDLSNTPEHVTRLNDGSDHPLSGYEQAVLLTAAITSTSTITIKDKFSSFTGVPVPSQCSVFELHSEGASLTKPGQYVATLTVRGV